MALTFNGPCLNFFDADHFKIHVNQQDRREQWQGHFLNGFSFFKVWVRLAFFPPSIFNSLLDPSPERGNSNWRELIPSNMAVTQATTHLNHHLKGEHAGEDVI